MQVQMLDDRCDLRHELDGRGTRPDHAARAWRSGRSRAPSAPSGTPCRGTRPGRETPGWQVRSSEPVAHTSTRARYSSPAARSTQRAAASSQRASSTAWLKRRCSRDPEAVDAVAHVVPDLGLGRERARPVRVQREGERIEVRGDVAAAAGVRVVPPGAAQVVAPVEDHEIVDPHVPEAGGHADAGEARTDDDDLEVLGHEVAATKSTTTRARSSPQSSWRKCPPPTMVVCGCPFAPAHLLLEVAVRPLGDGVAVAEGAEEGPVEGGQPDPGRDVGVMGRDRRAATAPASGTAARPPCSSRRGRARRRRPRPRDRAA